jgi:hypothetical protein
VICGIIDSFTDNGDDTFTGSLSLDTATINASFSGAPGATTRRNFKVQLFDYVHDNEIIYTGYVDIENSLIIQEPIDDPALIDTYNDRYVQLAPTNGLFRVSNSGKNLQLWDAASNSYKTVWLYNNALTIEGAT